MTDDVRKLLGGYATGTLSDEEKKLLFDAALQDDQLFAALADEQALKELLEDTAVRAQLLRATEEPRFSVAGAFREWFERPKAKALAAIGAVLVVLIGFNELRQGPPEYQQVAELRRAEPASPSAAPPAAVQPEPQLQAARPTPAAPRNAAEPTSNIREKKEETRQFVPPAASPAPPPPAAEAIIAEAPKPVITNRLMYSSAPLESGANATAAPVRYEILRREADGTYHPVAPDYEFSSDDLVRVRVTSSRTGAVAISQPNLSTISGSIHANEIAEFPRTGDIAVTPDLTKLVLVFAPANQEISPKEPAARRFVMEEAAKAKQTVSRPVTLEIPIRQRKP